MTGHAAPPFVDAHSDLLLELDHAARTQGEDNPFARRWLKPLRAGGVALQVCAIYVSHQLPPEEGLRQVLRNVLAFRAAVEGNRDSVFAVESRADLDRVGTDGRVGLLLALEGAAPLGVDAWLLDVLASLGLRMAALTWNERNAYADGCEHEGGLTALGGEALARIARLGIVLDLAHASPQTVADALVRTDAPVVVSHAACRAIYEHERNLSDEQLRDIARNGGVVGLMPHPLVVDPRTPTLERFLEHVDHAVAVMGVEHVGFGGDFLKQIMAALELNVVTADGVAADATLDGLDGQQDYPRLLSALRARGYEEPAIAAMVGGNMMRVLRRVLSEPRG